MAKNKKYRLTSDNKKTIKHFSDCVQNAASQSIYAESVQFSENSTKDEYRHTVAVRFSQFNLEIYYTPMYLLDNDCVDFRIRFDNSEYYYSIYDIFNFYDTPDFDLYAFCDCGAVSQMENAVNAIFQVCTRNLSNIDYFAKNEDALHKLEEQLEEEGCMMWGTVEEWKEVMQDASNLELFFERSLYDYTPKGIKNLMKHKDDDEFNSLYERRLIRYLDMGGTLNNTYTSKRMENEKHARKAIAKAIGFISFLAIGVALAVTLGGHAIIFKGAYTPMFTLEDVLIEVGVIAFFLFVSVFLLGARGIIGAFAGKEYKDAALMHYNKWNDNRTANKTLGRIIEIVVGIVMLLFAVLMSFVLLTATVGFYDDHVKFAPDTEFSICEISNEELEIYKVEGFMDGEDFLEYDNSYAIGKRGCYYSFGEVETGSDIENQLLDLSKEYNIEIKAIKTVEDID